MNTALLDVNILTALLWPAHEHHDAAHRWFRARARGRWATCPLTQLGFVRIVSNPAFSREALSPAAAMVCAAIGLAACYVPARRVSIRSSRFVTSGAVASG